MDLRDDVDFLRAVAWDLRNENDDIVDRGETEEVASVRSKLLDTLTVRKLLQRDGCQTKVWTPCGFAPRKCVGCSGMSTVGRICPQHFCFSWNVCYTESQKILNHTNT